ncbi:MAG: cell wall/surface repeat protein [Sphingobacteriales bacterium]|nr:cell wall/surface repeat protein [Sphingobacteriales bacterium]
MKKKITTIHPNTSAFKSTRYSTLYKSLSSLFILLAIFTAGCKKDDFKDEVVGLCPVVVSTDPMDKAVDVALNKVISATFNTDMKPATISKTTFTIKQGGALVSGTVSPTADGKTFTFKPDVDLLPFTVYTGTITTGATDTFKTAMLTDYVWTFTTIPQIMVTASPGTSGTVGGGGTFAQNAGVVVTAVPNANFTFVNWTVGGTEVSTSSNYSFAMSGNKALVANFIPVAVGNFAVNLSSSPAAGGITKGSGSYFAGSTVVVSASPNTGYTFVNWTEGANIVSTSSSYQFTIINNRTLVANYRVIPASQFAVVLSSSPANGGSTDGEGAYPSGTSVTITAAKNVGYTFINWTEKATGAVASTSAIYTFPLSTNRTLVANFVLNSYTLIVNATNGIVVKNPSQATYNHGTSVRLTATPSSGYVFSSWSGNATGSANPLTVLMTSDKNITANFTLIPLAVGIGPGPVDLKSADQYSILTKSGISSTGITAVEGDIGVSPAAASAITGFGLIMDTNGQSSHTTIATHVTGKVYAADYAAPTPSDLTVAIGDMQTAYTTANNLVTPAPILETGAGNISGLTLAPGLYKWSTGVLIAPNATVTLAGGPNDRWVFQIAQDLTLNSSAQVKLLGGAQAKNITWVVAGQAVLGTNTVLYGTILSKTLISLNTGSMVTGKLFAQTAVTLNTATVNQP